MLQHFQKIRYKDEKTKYINYNIRKINNIKLILRVKLSNKNTNLSVPLVKYLPNYIPLQPF